MKDLAIVVFGNRKDYFFTKICIASIRYFYPEIEIFLVKDHLNGNYNTIKLQKKFDVKLLDLGKKYFGWGASKIDFVLKKNLPTRRYLILDSDIIFLGKVLEQLTERDADFVLAPERYQPPFAEIQKAFYIDPDKIRKYYSDYEYPGFFFNTGQMIVTPGIISEELIAPGYDPHNYPYYKDWDVFRTVDQSILNSVIPVLMKRGQLTVDTVSFMAWSVSYFEDPKKDSIHQYLDGSHPLLVHYCGDVRTCKLDKMKGKNVLKFFKDQYLKKLTPGEKAIDSFQDRMSSYDKILNFNKWRNDKYLKILKKINQSF